MKTKVKCEKCGYEWETKSKLILITCASCGLKVKNKIKKDKKTIKFISK